MCFLGKITTTVARKTATSICTLIPGVCLLVLCYIGCRHYEAVSVMSVGIVAMGSMFSGFLSNHIDIAPNFAGTLVALTNTAATLPGIVVPLFVGFVTKGNVREMHLNILENIFKWLSRIILLAKHWRLAHHFRSDHRAVRLGIPGIRLLGIGQRAAVEQGRNSQGSRGQGRKDSVEGAAN